MIEVPVRGTIQRGTGTGTWRYMGDLWSRKATAPLMQFLLGSPQWNDAGMKGDVWNDDEALES